MRRPDTFVAKDKLLAILFSVDVPADGAATPKLCMKDLAGTARILSQARVRIRKEPAAGYVMEMRPAVTK